MARLARDGRIVDAGIDYMVVLSALPVMRKVLFSKFSHVVFAKWSSNS